MKREDLRTEMGKCGPGFRPPSRQCASRRRSCKLPSARRRGKVALVHKLQVITTPPPGPAEAKPRPSYRRAFTGLVRCAASGKVYRDEGACGCVSAQMLGFGGQAWRVTFRDGGAGHVTNNLWDAWDAPPGVYPVVDLLPITDREYRAARLAEGWQ